jgi:hypothetical protein
MTPDELRSDIRSAISVAAETNLFVGKLQANRGTAAFALGHLGYLNDEILRFAKELHESHGDPAMAQSVGICAAHLDSLAREIAVVQDKIKTNDINALSAGKARLNDIQDALTRLERRP